MDLVKIRIDDKVKAMVSDFINVGNPNEFNDVTFSWWFDESDLSYTFKLTKDAHNYPQQISTSLSDFSYEVIKILKSGEQWSDKGATVSPGIIIGSIINDITFYSETIMQLSELIDFGADCFYVKGFDEWKRFIEAYNEYKKHKEAAK